MKKEENKNLFEYRVLMVACVLGFIRSVIAVVGDFDGPELHVDFWTDFLFTIIFLFAIVALLFIRSFRWLLFFFYLPFIILLVISFAQSGGLQASIDHNIFAGIILVTLTLRGRIPLLSSAFLIIGTLVAFLYLEWQFDISSTFENRHKNDLNFIFASICIIGFTYYAKNVFSNKRSKLHESADELKKKTKELTIKTDELLTQKEELESLTLALDKKVTNRTRALKNQKKRREKYLSITLNELTNTYQKTITLIDGMDRESKDEQLMEMLMASKENLKKEMVVLKEKVNADH